MSGGANEGNGIWVLMGLAAIATAFSFYAVRQCWQRLRGGEYAEPECDCGRLWCAWNGVPLARWLRRGDMLRVLVQRLFGIRPCGECRVTLVESPNLFCAYCLDRIMEEVALCE